MTDQDLQFGIILTLLILATLNTIGWSMFSLEAGQLQELRRQLEDK